MPAREGMTALVSEVRRLSNAGTAEATIAGETYWSDEQIQNILDRYRTTHRQLELMSSPVYTGGSYYYYEYPFPPNVSSYIERAGSASGFVVQTTEGGTAGSYSVNYDAKIITFAADQGGTAYFMDCREYDVYGAAADVWEAKAGHISASAIDWSSDNHSIKNSQREANYLKMADKLRAQSGGRIRTSIMVRTDEYWNN